MTLVQNLYRGLPTAVPFTRHAVLFLLFSISTLLASMPAQAQDQAPSTRIEFLKYGSMATTVAQSPDGRHLAIGARDVPGGGSRVVLWNQSTEERVRTVTFPANQAPKIAFDSSGTRLAVGPAERGSFIWSLQDDHSAPLQLDSTPANDLAFGLGGTLGIGETSGDGGAVRVWPNGPNSAPTVLETEGSVRSIALSENTSDVVLATGPAQVTLWNYRFNTTKQFSTFEGCPGELRQVGMVGGRDSLADHFYVVTQRRAECDPDYLCRIDAETRRVTDRIRRKNIRNVIPLDGERVAFSRGRYVYTLNLRTQEERIVFQSDNAIRDLSYGNGRLAVATADVAVLNL